MMNVIVFSTGGTIGSAFDGAAVDVCAGGGCAVADRYAATHPDVRFEVRNPLNILSEQITAADFNQLVKVVYEAEITRFDGAILTVGSDNLAYIASLIGLLFGDSGVPVVLVASDKVLTDPAANGYDNFCCAVDLIAQGLTGAWVPYGNSDGVMAIHAATDLRQADLSDDFTSFHGACALWDGALQPLREPTIQTIPKVFDAQRPPVISDNVLLIHPYPMQDYAALDTTHKKAALHTLYHSGTLDARVRVLTDTPAKPPLYLASLRRGRSLYASTAEVIRAGAIPLYDISPECAYMKLLLACAQDRMSVKEFMERER